MKRDGTVPAAEHLIHAGATVKDALLRLNALPGERMTLFVSDDNGRLAGSLTDGDIRRALLRGVTTSSPVTDAMHYPFRAIWPDDDRFETVAALRHSSINPLPVLDADGHIIEMLDLTSLHAALPVEAVLMAGGRGERLRPLTLDTPKPLLKVGGKAIIDYNVDALRANGVDKIYVTVNYLKNQIAEHFERRGDGIQCVAEPQRMGTFGSLSLIPPPAQKNVLVMNSDLLTDISFEALYRRHIETGAALTMSVVPYSVSVPFAIVDTEDDTVRALREKPTYNYFANAGVYLMQADLLSMIAPDTYLDAPDFIESLITKELKVSYFPIQGTWIDIGSPEDYRRADRLMAASHQHLSDK